MRHLTGLRVIVVAGLLMFGCKDQPVVDVPLTLANHGTKKLVFEVVANKPGQDVKTARRVVRVILDPGKSAKYELPSGKYTLFPREWMFQGTFGLAFYPFRLKPGKPMVITLDSTNRPTFTGSAKWTDIRSVVTPLAKGSDAKGSAIVAKPLKAGR